MSEVLVLGALHHDVVVDAPRLPRIDETLVGSGVDYRFGGKGGNQAVAAARMGARVAMAGRVGADAAGRHMLAVLDAAGVERSRVLAGAAPSGMSVAITLPDGTYGAVIVAGANRENDGHFPLPEHCHVCLLQQEIPELANIALAERLPKTVTVILNAAPVRAIPGALLARTDVLVVNRLEAHQFTGLDDPRGALEKIWERGHRVVLTLGADGLLIHDKDGPDHLPGHRVKVVSTHGAGDMFTGTLAARMALGDPLRSAAAFAQGAAALHVSSPIATRGSVTGHAVERFLQSMP